MRYLASQWAGQFNIPRVLRVNSDGDVGRIATAIVIRIKEGGSCVIESFGKMPAVISVQVRTAGVKGNPI